MSERNKIGHQFDCLSAVAEAIGETNTVYLNVRKTPAMATILGE